MRRSNHLVAKMFPRACPGYDRWRWGPDTVLILRHSLTLGRGAVTAQLTVMAVLLIAINTVWQVPMVWAADAIRSRLANPSVQRAASRLSGVILLVMAAALLFENLFAGR